jgi:hypothetical protein
MAAAHPNSFKARKTLKVGSRSYTYFSLAAVEKEVGDLSRLPFSLRVLLENLLRHEDGRTVKKADIAAFADWLKNGGKSVKEINFRPARVLMQDFTGVPAVVDLAAMRDAMGPLGGDARKINPLVPVDLVIDHSVIVDNFGNASAFGANVKLEYERNLERYQFLRWGQMAFDNFRVVPPGTGICHQVNLEYLAQVVWTKKDGKETIAYPDTLVGTDSHTTMVNGLSVLGWGVGGIEAEAAMLGQPLPMVIPDVVGFKMTGKLREGATAMRSHDDQVDLRVHAGQLAVAGDGVPVGQRRAQQPGRSLDGGARRLHARGDHGGDGGHDPLVARLQRVEDRRVGVGLAPQQVRQHGRRGEFVVEHRDRAPQVGREVAGPYGHRAARRGHADRCNVLLANSRGGDRLANCRAHLLEAVFLPFRRLGRQRHDAVVGAACVGTAAGHSVAKELDLQMKIVLGNSEVVLC